MATVDSIPLPDIELVETDGKPMDSTWHRENMNLLIEQTRHHQGGRRDYFVGGNMFIYFNLEQARNRDFRGPDYFFVRGVRWEPLRPYYVVWEEGGKYPDTIIELMSPSTADEDLTTKKEVYQNTFRTPEYFCYDPDTKTLLGWRLVDQSYEPIKPNEHGWLWSGQLGLWLGTWTGTYQGMTAVWLRFYDESGKVVLTSHEVAELSSLRAQEEHQRAEAERLRADAERRRAEIAESELAKLKAQKKVKKKGRS